MIGVKLVILAILSQP